jgi:hypothetical protein
MECASEQKVIMSVTKHCPTNIQLHERAAKWQLIMHESYMVIGMSVVVRC